MLGLSPVSVRDVHAAAARLRLSLLPTPLVHSDPRRAWLKLESRQITGAYKVRGALNALKCQLERGDSRPVIAASAGNHGAGVAWAARRLGLHARIVVPRSAPRVKIRRIRSLGAEVIVQGETFDESAHWAQRQAQLHRWRFLHAFDEPDVIAGQGTIALELLALRPDVVVLPIGGGGLASGVSLVLRSEGIRVVGVQVEGVDAMASVLRGGPSRIEPAETVADGLRVCEAGQLTRRICGQLLDEVLLVSEADVRRTMRSLAQLEGLRVEGAGAVAVAALPQVTGACRVAVITGGNVDPQTLRAVRDSRAEPRGAVASDRRRAERLI